MDCNWLDFSKKDILIVDDTPANLRFLAKMLTQEGYKVRKALNGKIAIYSCQKSLPDLILLDIMMPDMDGYEVCQKLKADRETQDIPVIFISALNETWDKVKAFHVGGADYITKPFQIEEVLARVAHQLTIQQMQRTLLEQNAQLEKLNQELKKSNAELEQFAYIASHDLKSPLQAMLGYAHALNWKYEKNLDANGKRYIDLIVGAAWRMKDLIDDLLSYSRVRTDNHEFEPIECQIILSDVLNNLQAEISASSAKIIYSELPKLVGDRTQIMQLFQNLISNAIKFHRPNEPPIVKISAELKNEREWVVGIHDNGIGIAPENFDRIFEIFQRLHSYKEYPGNGIGMTICKKIVERHGGRIWLESQLGEGTSFYFTFPSK